MEDEQKNWNRRRPQKIEMEDDQKIKMEDDQKIQNGR